MKLRLILNLAALAITPAYARIGETEDECTKRYGKPTSHEHSDNPPSDCTVYETGRFQVKAYFLNGHAEALLVHTRDHSPFCQDELDVIMNANSAGATWSLVSSGTSRQARIYQRSDDLATLTIVKDESLLIESAQWKAAAQGMSKF